MLVFMASTSVPARGQLIALRLTTSELRSLDKLVLRDKRRGQTASRSSVLRALLAKAAETQARQEEHERLYGDG